MKMMKSRFKGYCGLCLYTIWPGEMINYDGTAYHLDCEKAMKDNTPRRMKELRSSTDWTKDSRSLQRRVLSKNLLEISSRKS